MKAFNFFSKFSLFILCFTFGFSLFSGQAMATVGGAGHASSYFYNENGDFVSFVYTKGGEIGFPANKELKTLNLTDGSVATYASGAERLFITQADSWEEFENNFLTEDSVELKEVDLRSIEMTFEAKQINARIPDASTFVDEINLFKSYNPDIEEEAVQVYLEELIFKNSKLIWEITAKQNGKELNKVRVTSCIDLDALQDSRDIDSGFRAYSLPGKDFIVLVTRVIDECFEISYAEDHIGLISNVDLSNASFVHASENNTGTSYESRYAIDYDFATKLVDHNLSEQIIVDANTYLKDEKVVLDETEQVSDSDQRTAPDEGQSALLIIILLSAGLITIAAIVLLTMFTKRK